MARFFSISLLLLFLGNVIGGISLLLIQRHQRHEYIESQIKSASYNHALTQIELAANQLNEIKWVEHEHEFRYKGEMYDVVRIETTSTGGKIFHCIADQVETELYAQIERNLGNSQQQDQMIVLQMFKFVSEFLFPVKQLQNIDVCSRHKCDTIYLRSILKATLSLPAQPPDMA